MERYFTQSLNMAAYLKYKGFEIIDTETNRNVTTFYFDKTDDLHKAVKNYNNDIELKKFITAFREVKELIKR